MADKEDIEIYSDEDDDESVVSDNDDTSVIEEDDETFVDGYKSDEEILDEDDNEDNDKVNKPAPPLEQTIQQQQHQQQYYDSDEDDVEDENYLQKFNEDVNRNYMAELHPEQLKHNYEEISSLTQIVRDKQNNIIDKLHRTLPYLTKYERARIIGQRAKQLNSGANAFIKVPDHIIDGAIIADMELEQKKIPFIIRRPLPGGGCEYWNLKDLEILTF
jgi:DNA-directed RNA polymerases I, II, and III subunit RPABC2